MAVPVERHRRCCVSKEPLHDLDVSACADRQRGRGVPQTVRYQPSIPDLVAGVVECPAVFTERQESALTAGEHQGVRVGGQLGMEPAPNRLRHWYVTIPLRLGRRLNDALAGHRRRGRSDGQHAIPHMLAPQGNSLTEP